MLCRRWKGRGEGEDVRGKVEGWRERGGRERKGGRVEGKGRM